MHVTHGDAAHVWVRFEDGTVRSDVRQLDNFTPPFELDGRAIGEATFALPADLPLGYHRVHLRTADYETSTALIVTPPWLGSPAGAGTGREWGMATQLYSVRSKRSWGVGDLSDLTDLAVWSGSRHGAGYVLVNPLHAAAPTSPMEPSPYLPTSRRFVNPLYLRIEAIPEYSDLRKRSRVRRLRDDVRAHARKIDAIDRDTAWAAKRKALKLVHACRGRRGASWRTRRSVRVRVMRSTISRRGARSPSVRRRLASMAGVVTPPRRGRGRRYRRKAQHRSRFLSMVAVADR